MHYNKKYFLILDVLSSMSTIWIPQILVYYKLDHQKFAWFPFVLPGITTLLLIFIFKKVKQNSDRKVCLSYIFLVIIFLFSVFCKLNLLIITLLFSIITGICQLIQITIQQWIFQITLILPIIFGYNR